MTLFPLQEMLTSCSRLNIRKISQSLVPRRMNFVLTRFIWCLRVTRVSQKTLHYSRFYFPNKSWCYRFVTRGYRKSQKPTDPARSRGWDKVRCVGVGTVAECIILQCMYERFTAAGMICIYQPAYDIANDIRL